MIETTKQKQKKLIQLLRMKKDMLDDEPAVDAVMKVLGLSQEDSMKMVKEHVDAATPAVVSSLLEQLTPLIQKEIEAKKGADGKNGIDGKDGIDGMDGVDGKDGKDGKDGSPDTPKDIKTKLESLEGEDRLDAKAIKNLPKSVTQIVDGGFHSGAYETPIKNSSGVPISKDASGAWILPSSSGGGVGTYTYIVATSGGDFTDLQSAIDALGTGGGRIFVKAGTYTVGAAGIRIGANNITIEGEGPATRFNFNSSSLSTFLATSGGTTQRTVNKFRNFRISQQGTAGTGTAVDFSYFTENIFENIRIDGCNVGFTGTGTGTLYNRFYNCTASVSGASSKGFECGTVANENAFYSCRSLASGATLGAEVTTGFAINAHSNKLIDCVAETHHLVGIDIQASGNDCTIIGPYLELNATNMQLASGVEATFVGGGFIGDGTTYNITNNGAKGFAFESVRLQYEQFTYHEGQAGFPKFRFIYSMHTGESLNVVDQIPAAAGRVFVQEVNIEESVFVDGVYIMNGTAVAGNVTVGLYGPATTEETPAGTAVVVQSASTAVAGLNLFQLISLTTTRINAGRYWVAIEYSDATTMKYNRAANFVAPNSAIGYYDRGGGYGALTDPLPAISVTGSAMPQFRLRCTTLTNI